MNNVKITHFDKSIATIRDILLHEIAHIVVCEYYKIPVLRLHFDPPHGDIKIDTDDPKNDCIKNEILKGTPPKKYKKDLRKRFHIRLAGEVFNHSYEYGFQLDDTDIQLIKATTEGRQTLEMATNLLDFQKLASDTLIILKKRIVRIHHLYEILLPELKKSKIVNIPPPEQPTTILQSLWNTMIELSRPLFH